MLESIDDGVGLITKKLDKLGLAENTIIVFTSDNGGESKHVTTNAPLRAGKSHLYEGGIRVPLVVRWPGVVPTGKRCDTPTSNVDFYPTFLAAASIPPDAKQKLDGISILPVLKDPKARVNRDTIYWHYPLKRRHFLGGRSGGAILQGQWKLIEYFSTGKLELYNLKDDLGEKNNLAAELPDKVKLLRTALSTWRKQVGAKIE